MLLGLVLCQSVRGPAENRENDFIRLSVKKADEFKRLPADLVKLCTFRCSIRTLLVDTAENGP